MKLSLCSISFRHTLCELRCLIDWCASVGIEGIELWGPHAMVSDEEISRGRCYAAQNHVKLTLISSYLSFHQPLDDMIREMHALCICAQKWGVLAVRLFANDVGSNSIQKEAYIESVKRLKILCSIGANYNVEILIETHPSTLADSTEATITLLQDVDHEALKINFDVLHIWEAQNDIYESWRTLQPFVANVHLKNIGDPVDFSVFHPTNIYSPNSQRSNIVGLFEGNIDYTSFLKKIKDKDHLYFGLEWFGKEPYKHIYRDSEEVKRLFGEGEKQ
ncbi:MAG: sugar phosphate isomerase/epimerase family protein [Bacilli bacterium]